MSPAGEGAGTARPLRIGVSSCLLGDEVRWDGRHKRDAFLSDEVSRFATLVRVCPEVELGLGVPREPIRLERRGAGPVRLVAPGSGRDLTADMSRWAERRVRALAREDLDGFVLKEGSPSCGLERVNVWNARGRAARRGRGVFAEALLRSLPLLPVEEESRLCDAGARASFLERALAHRRLKDALRGRWTLRDLAAFHERERLLLLARDPRAYRRLERVVSTAKDRPRAEVAREYAAGFMAALARPPSRDREGDVLRQAAETFRQLLTPGERAELDDGISAYRAGGLPLLAPLTLVRHHVRRHAEAPEVSRLGAQSWLGPHPDELLLRKP